MTERIDAFAHYLPESFYRELEERGVVSALGGEPAFLWSDERRLDDMDAYGVDKQVIALGMPTAWRGMDRETALELTRLANDGLRAFADEHPDRFVPVGTLPYPDGGFIEEYERCVSDLDVAGIQLFSNVDGRPIDDRSFEELYGRMADDGVPVWLHPQHHEWYAWIDERMDHRLFGWPFDTTLALSRLVFGGVFERHPELDIVAHHLGGMVPFYGARIDMFYRTRLAYPDTYDTEFPEFSTPPVEQFRGLYADTAVDGSTPALACARSFYDDGHVLFGTDYPFGPERGRAKVRATVESIERAGLDDDERAAVYAGNLRSLLE